MLKIIVNNPVFAGRLKSLFTTQFLKKYYHENVIDHYENPRNVGSLDKTKKNVGTGKGQFKII